MPETATAPFSVVAKVRSAMERRIKVYPCNTNRASELGHDCERYLVYNRTCWEKKAPHGVDSEFIFEAGRRIEDEAIAELAEAGFQVLEQQRSFRYPDEALNITGHLDLKIANGDGVAYPCEIKGLNQWDFAKLNMIEDFFDSTKPWIRKYPAQLYLYLLMSNSELGLFYLKDKQSHQPKEIWVPLDYAYTEQLLAKAERINAHVAAGTMPDPIPFNDQICRWCSFMHLCVPDRDLGDGAQLIEDPDFEEKLKRRAELEAAKKEYDAIDRQIKAQVKEKDNLIVGDFVISGQWVERKAYSVEAGRYWKTSIMQQGVK